MLKSWVSENLRAIRSSRNLLVTASAVIGSVTQLIVARDELNERWQFDFLVYALQLIFII